MSSNFNNAKIINVYYNKGDRKPYDVNGKPIAYIGQESIGATEATTIRFYLGEDLDSSTAVIVTKRPDNERRLDVCVKLGTGVNSYYEVTLNAWYGAVKGKATLAFKVYNGDVEFDDVENPTEIISVEGRIVVSDIFNLEIAYAPEADLTVPPDDSEPYQDWFFALSTKLDKADSITVAGALPTLTGDVYDDRYFYIENEGVGRLYYINGSSAIEVVWGIGTLALASNGNEDITVGTNAGKMYWDEDRGTIIAGLYDDQEAGIGDSLFFFGKATEAIAKGEVVQFNGNTGGNIRIKKAVFAEISAQPDLLMGVAKHAIALNDFGYVVSFGYVRNLNTTAFTTPILYLSTSVAGALSSTKPTTGFKGSIAAVARPSTGGGSNGFLIVRPNLVKGIGDLADVTITTATSGQILSFDGSKWVNSTRLTTAETDIANIEDGTTIVGKALGDQNGNTIDTTYLTIASGSSTYVPLSSKGVANGVAPLGADNKIPSIHLPGGVDDIKEFANLASFPVVGEASIIYVALDTNKIYRWSGTAYVEISSSLALGTTSSTAFPGDRGLATETKTDNIVSGTQTLTNTRITNSAVGTSPLIINAIASTTALLQQWQVNSGVLASIDSNGWLRTNGGLANANGFSNSSIQSSTTGAIISRNIADANPSLIVNQANASSTGDILRLQSAGANVLEITRTGGLNQNGTRLFSQPTETSNTFFGSSSGGTATTGVRNTGFGISALTALTSGASNVAVGRNALVGLTTGSNNTAIGTASSNLINGSGNTSVGYQTSQSITGGSNNTFIGSDAGNNASQLVSATNSTALGNAAYTDKSNQMVFGNASVSEFVFNRNTSAVLLAPQTLISSATFPPLSVERTSSQTNVSLGTSLFKHKTSGDMADGFGGNFEFSIEDGANVNNVIARVGAVRSGADNSGRLIFKTTSAGTDTEKMTILPNGNVGIGTASPARLLDLVASVVDGPLLRLQNTNTAGYSGVHFVNNSGGVVGHFGYGNASVSGSLVDNMYFGSISSKNILLTTTDTERMRITATGLVGINETSPTAQLVVKSGATDRVGLSVTTTATTGYTANIASFSANGAERIFFENNGNIRTRNGVSNYTGATNAYINVSDTGTIISRNVADSNPALITNLANASATGNIQVWQKATNALLAVSNDGSLINPTAANSKLSLTSTGALIERNINDANVALKINQQQGTGKIASFQFGGVEKSFIDKDGNFSGASVQPTYTNLGSRLGSAGDGTITVSDITGFDELIVDFWYEGIEQHTVRSQAPVSTHWQPTGAGDKNGMTLLQVAKGGTTVVSATVRQASNTSLDVDFGGTVTNFGVTIYGVNW
jgi:hypothetical protein